MAATRFSRYTIRADHVSLGGLLDRAAALRRAATQITRYGKAVGMLVQHGRHAVVMNGFASTHNPLTGAFTITGVWVSDPLGARNAYYSAAGSTARHVPPAGRDDEVRPGLVRQVHRHRPAELNAARAAATDRSRYGLSGGTATLSQRSPVARRVTKVCANGFSSREISVPLASYVSSVTVPRESKPRLSPVWTPNGTISRTFIESKR